MTNSVASGMWFLAVGSAAAVTHLAVFVWAQHRVSPEMANAIGFSVAFFISFSGHRLLSFRDASTTLTRSLRRFAVIALAGFATNEGIFVVLLRFAGWPASVALVTALLVAAGQTFLLSRFWAFKR